MRKIVHRILTGAPTFALAILALLAGADPSGALARLHRFADLMSDTRFFWLCVVIVVGYAALWWVTSYEQKTRRQKIQEGLRPHLGTMTDMQQAFISAVTDDDFLAAEARFDSVLQPCAQWIMDNMGAVAFKRFNTPTCKAGSYFWSGQHDPAVMETRNGVMLLNAARIDVIEQFLGSDAWDGVATTKWQLLKRWLKA